MRLEEYFVDADTKAEYERLDYVEILRLRARAYKERVAKMEIPVPIQTWAAKMTARYGPTVRVWKNECGWLVALMITRYGEDPLKWPASFTTADVDRAIAWAKGRRYNGHKGSAPRGVVYPDVSDLGMVADGPLLGLAGVAAGLLSGWAGAILTVLGITWLLGALSNFLENELVDHVWRGRAFSAPTDHYFGLFTAAPGEAGGGTEVTGGSYARVQLASTFTNFEGTGGETTNVDSAGTGGATQNRVVITFPTPSANWGVASHMGDLDAASAGNFYAYGALTTPKTINNGDPAPAFAVGAYDLQLDN